MSCVLRASGANFDVDSFLKDSTLRPLIVYHRGSVRFPSSNRTQRLEEESGMNVEVSAKEFSDLPGQIRNAIQFLLDNTYELDRLVGFPELQRIVLDFPVENRDVPVQSDTFPAELALLLGNLRIGLVVSHYRAH